MANSNPKRDLKPRNPGEPAPEQQMPPQEPESTQDALGAAPEQDGPETWSDEQLAMIEAEVQRRVKAQRRAAMEPKQPASALPKQSEINPREISRAVLTQDGYVCPIPKPKAQQVIN